MGYRGKASITVMVEGEFDTDVTGAIQALTKATDQVRGVLVRAEWPSKVAVSIGDPLVHSMVLSREGPLDVDQSEPAAPKRKRGRPRKQPEQQPSETKAEQPELEAEQPAPTLSAVPDTSAQEEAPQQVADDRLPPPPPMPPLAPLPTQ